MDIFTKEELESLAGPHNGWCVSIYMPTIEAGQQTRQNHIRFKNLLDQAKDTLGQTGMEPDVISGFMDRADELQRDTTFWQHQEEGLAVFIGPDIFKYYRLPVEVEEQMIVSDRFYLKPLLPLLHDQRTFYILAVSQNQVRLLKASQYEVEEIDVPEMPKSLAEALRYDDPEESLQFHTDTANPNGGFNNQMPAMWFGQGEGDDSQITRIRRYLGKVNKAVAGYLKENTSPLILASVEYLLPIYQDANTYNHLLDEVVPGNPEDVKDTELRDKGWQIVAPLYQSEKKDKSGMYRLMHGRHDQRAVTDIKEIVKAAPYGRVEVLFVDKNANKWGTFDRKNVEVRLENNPRPGNQDLLDFAAVETILHGGKVFAVEPQDIPDENTPIAAIFRY